MPLHLIKLAVGCDSVRELREWVAERMATAKKKGLPLRHVHITRMTPKREEEILAGGSLYWVIRGEIAAREKIIAIEPFRDKDGIGRCRIVMVAGRKSLNHPKKGRLRFEYASFQANDDPALKLVIYGPA